MTGYYYDDPLAAAWMAKHFGMKFWNGEHEICVTPLVDSEAEAKRYIHQDSLHLLEPQEGDWGRTKSGRFAIFDGYGRAWRDRSGNFLVDAEIIFRNGLAFHWPIFARPRMESFRRYPRHHRRPAGRGEAAMSTETFQSWAIVEVMGHVTYAGYVTAETIAGHAMLRIDVPECGAIPAYTKYISPSALYGLTPVTEETARAKAASMSRAPFDSWSVEQAVIKDLERRGRLIEQTPSPVDDCPF